MITYRFCRKIFVRRHYGIKIIFLMLIIAIIFISNTRDIDKSLNEESDNEINAKRLHLQQKYLVCHTYSRHLICWFFTFYFVSLHKIYQIYAFDALKTLISNSNIFKKVKKTLLLLFIICQSTNNLDFRSNWTLNLRLTLDLKFWSQKLSEMTQWNEKFLGKSMIQIK